MKTKKIGEVNNQPIKVINSSINVQKSVDMIIKESAMSERPRNRAERRKKK
jgi:hypothetical protein